MRIINLNPDTDIGASAWFVELDGNRLLMDAGAHPKREGRASQPLYSLVADEALDAIALSHCHHDHVGTLPVAMRHFPRAHVLMTELSGHLIGRVLHNSVNVMVRQRDENGVKDYPLYTHNELEELEPRFQGFKYNREVEWNSHAKARAGRPSPTLEFFDAGHALGSAGILVRENRNRSFTRGTFVSTTRPSSRPPDFPTCGPTSSSWKPRGATAPRPAVSRARRRPSGWRGRWGGFWAKAAAC